MAVQIPPAALYRENAMSKDQARLRHLLVRMQDRYGEHDADVLQLRDALLRLELDETRIRGTLRYSDAPLFCDRAARLAHVGQDPVLL